MILHGNGRVASWGEEASRGVRVGWWVYKAAAEE